MLASYFSFVCYSQPPQCRQHDPNALFSIWTFITADLDRIKPGRESRHFALNWTSILANAFSLFDALSREEILSTADCDFTVSSIEQL